MSDFNSLVQYTVENISRPVKYIIYKLTEFIRVVDKFVFRQVPSGAASGYATIEKIEGNTVAWNQLTKLKSSRTINSITFTTNGMYIYGQGTPSSRYNGETFITSAQWDGIPSIINHIYYIKAIGTIEGCNIVFGISSSGTSINDGALRTYSTTFAGQPVIIVMHIFQNVLTPVNVDVYLNIIDLTAIFGAGNEPTTVADFEAWMAQNIGTLPYYDYNAGELISCKMESLKSIGFNQFDYDTMWGTIGTKGTNNDVQILGSSGTSLKPLLQNINFLPNTSYCFTYKQYCSSGNNIRMCILYTDGTDEEIGRNNTSDYVTLTKTSNASKTVSNVILRYQSIGVIIIKDICINISDPSKNGTYQPYMTDSADIDVTTITGINTATNVREVIFPNGMNQADREGTINDTLDLRSDTATVKVGSRAYQSGDDENPSMVTDGANITNYPLYPNEVEKNLPLYIEDISGTNNTLSILKNSSDAPTTTVEYSFDNVMWQTLGTTSTTALTIDIPANGRCYIRANANAWGGQSGSTQINTSNNSLVGGNISSIIYGENFRNSANIPFTTSNNRCYQSLFRNNTNLVYADKLFFDNKTSTFMCFGMFSGCTALKTAPLFLPTNLTTFCFYTMFSECSSLQSTPFLMAKTLFQACYYQMFKNCSSLNKVIIGADDISASNCVLNWLDGVSATGTFYNLGAATYPSGASGIPSGWTTETTAPYQSQVLTYTDLQDANGNPLNPRYKVEQGGTEQILPANTSTPTTVAPTLTTTYTKDVH